MQLMADLISYILTYASELLLLSSGTQIEG